MPMERNNHEEILNELLTPDLETSRKTELLQSLRADYSNVLTDFSTLAQTKEKLEKDNDDLIVSNSKLFRQIGIVDTEVKKKEDQKSFSETITIDQLEKE